MEVSGVSVSDDGKGPLADITLLEMSETKGHFRRTYIALRFEDAAKAKGFKAKEKYQVKFTLKKLEK